LSTLGLRDVPCPACGADDGVEAFYARAHASNRSELRFRYCTCRDCGAVYCSPRVCSDQIDQFYPCDYHPARTHRQRIDKGLHQLGIVLEMGLRSPGRVLDWGSGSGEFVEVLRMLGFEAYGYEPQRAPGTALQQEGILYELGEVLGVLPEIETVTLLDVLEHLDDPSGLLSLWAAHTQADVYVLTPRGDSPEVRRFRGNAYTVQAPTHLFMPTRESLERLGRRTGWSVSFPPQPTTSFWPFDWQLALGGRTYAAQGSHHLKDRVIRRLATLIVTLTKPDTSGCSAHIAAILSRRPADNDRPERTGPRRDPRYE
jgi:Methyltransferase domain